MPRAVRMALGAFVALSVALLGQHVAVAGATATPTCTDQFTAAQSAAWENSANWSNGLPTSSTVACWSGVTVTISTGAEAVDAVETGQGGSLSISGGSLRVNSLTDSSTLDDLTLSGGTLQSNITISVDGNISWTGGSLGAVVSQTGGGSCAISGSGTPVLATNGISTTSSVTITNPHLATMGGGLATTGTLTLGAGVSIAASGAQATFQAATLAPNTGASYGFGSAALVLTGSGSTVAAGTTLTAGTVTLDNGSLVADGTISTFLVTIDLGQLSGSGTITGALDNPNGVVTPGDPLGKLTVQGGYTQGASGGLVIAIAGTTAGGGYTQLVSPPGAVLSGSLYVADQGGFAPSAGDTFTVVAGARGGGFAQVIGPSAALYQQQALSAGVSLVSVPYSVVPPSLSGFTGPQTARVGDTLTCSPGTWANNAASFAYTWWVNGAQQSGNAGSPQTYSVTPSDLAALVWCAVSASDGVTTSRAVTSARLVVSQTPIPTVPPAVSSPSGTDLGAALVEVPASWTDVIQLSFIRTYQWLRCAADGSTCQPIPSASDASYQLTGADLGSTLRVSETMSTIYGDLGTATSSPSAVVAAAPTVTATPPSTPPSTSGTSGAPAPQPAGTSSVPPSAPAPPIAQIVSASIRSRHRDATFRFKASGDATGYMCGLIRLRAGRNTSQRPHYAACGTTKTFRRLSGGTYTLYVRAVGPGGDSAPARRTFNIA